MDEAEKAAAVAAIVRVQTPWWIRALYRLVPKAWRQEAYARAWDNVEASRRAAVLLDAASRRPGNGKEAG